MKRWHALALGALLGLGFGVAARAGYRIGHELLKALKNDPEVYREDMDRFAREDRLRRPPAEVAVFTGSSSITFWETLQRDMAPLPVINRAFGGSRMRDVVYWAERAVIAYRPRAVVLFAGTNDLSGAQPKTPQEVYEGYLEFVRVIHADLPGTPIYYIGITPTPSRWKHWRAAGEANRLIRARAGGDARLHFIDLTEAILGPDGKPDRKLYRLDRLHPSKQGYARWTSVIKPVLLADLTPLPERPSA